MTDEQLNEIEALEKAATPRPWRLDEMGMFVFGPDSEMIVSEGFLSEQGNVILRGAGRGLPMEANAAFIAASRAAVPQLIAEVRRLRAMIDRAPHEGAPFCAIDHEGKCTCWKAGL